MAVADSVFEVAGDFGLITVRIRAVASHAGLAVLAHVAVSELEVDDHLAM